MSSQNVFASFLELQKTRLAVSSVQAYERDLRDFATWFAQTNGQELGPQAVTSIDMREYQSWLQTVAGRKPQTVNRRLLVIRMWLAWCQEQGIIGRLPGMPRPVREQKAAPKALERVEQNRLLREVERRGSTRDLALVRLLLGAGLRISEAVGLRREDVTMGERSGYVVVSQGKGNKRREVPLPAETRKVLKVWLDEHPGGPWLFPGRTERHLTARQAQKMLAQLAVFARVEVTPHGLRHTAATNMLSSGADLVTVAEILGHESLDTTARYTKPSARKMAEVVEKGEV
ncbi:tyrosine-type recombinase/integrase [Heliobacterium undosum]|uniref:Tyrosine-type recombinase/integrase n=1 Tax=Heliomicrobium undosum TaxID=121734 RepID=A0A845L3X5_9FIRM|nr:tyrosine-type recombinase/integrase [Heliomicrobium undosum]MZP31347.1 tyrosine-type recombinase/integrase [Heliomicrobium undosum]